ncbi:DUF4442 domain-containing protein [bacterium]|nr:MAG: DUF4442 domain-containing protein [bacterium]
MSKVKQPLYEYWKTANKFPFGRAIYNWILRVYIPYTGSIKSRIEHLEPGLAVVSLKERRAIRNHLRSIHALAIANLGEFAGNLALFAGMPGDARLIVKGFDIRYLKKARGIITATAQTPVLETNEKQDIEINVEIKDESGEIVSTYILYTLVGPVK